MCGRFTLTSLDDQIQDLFDVLEVPEREARFNIAPTQQIIVISKPGEKRTASAMRWGLVPNHATELSASVSTFNARAETIHEKPTFRNAFEQRRCLIPADGFYEWKTIGTYRQPYRFKREDDQLFAFAGVWDRWSNSDGETIESASIITTTPNTMVEKYHDRMPVILPRSAWKKWLAPDTSPQEAAALLVPCESDFLTAYPVDVRVGNVRFEQPEALARTEIQGDLF